MVTVLTCKVSGNNQNKFNDADEFHLSVIFEAILAALSTNAGLLEAAKGRRIGQSVVGIHLPGVGSFWLL